MFDFYFFDFLKIFSVIFRLGILFLYSIKIKENIINEFFYAYLFGLFLVCLVGYKNKYLLRFGVGVKHPLMTMLSSSNSLLLFFLLLRLNEVMIKRI
ncbi:Uncharacterised protein [Vibrio cholerae]|uniref:Uncharacterized protein n=1 Tax=Vibrio cholerae TaxID=666 RepID=A0A655X322_VIBCL|nr:Uncharacterised protein [Vibrio cholerae]